jgi:hypothetical protein
MLPVTHGSEFTRLQVLLYTLVLFAATLLPFIHRHERLALPGAAVVLGAGSSPMPGAVARLQRRAGAQDLPLLDLALALLFAALLVDHYLVAMAVTPLKTACAHAPLSRWLALAAVPCRLRRCVPGVAARLQVHRHHRCRVRPHARCPTPTASCARWPTSRARWWWCSSATPSAPTCARPPWPSWPRSSAMLGADGARVQGSSSPSTRSATRPNC